jgi:restriction system protein
LARERAVARRKRRKTSDATGLLVLLALMAAGGLVLSVLSFLARSPALLVPLLAAGGGLTFWRVNTRIRRNRELAEARRQQAQIYAARALAIESYHAMNFRQFEEALAYLCRRDGCPEAHVTGKTGDLGADVLAITPDGRRLVIQAKRYVPGNQVTGPDLQKFGGTCYAVHRADIAAVVTTSGFTKQARQYASAMRIALFDNDALAGWAARNGPPPWLTLPPPPGSMTPPGQQPQGKHSRPTPSH